jgi:hypothetical protein
MTITRDASLLLVAVVAGLLGFLGAHFELLQQAFPNLSAVWASRIELASGLIAIIAGYLRMSPLRLSRDNNLSDGTANPMKTLSIMGQSK